MHQGQIFKSLWKGLLLTFVLSAILTLILIPIVFAEESKGFEGGQGAVLLSIGGVIWSFALTVSATTVFLNLYPAVRNSAYYCFLSYFIVPFFIALYVGLNAGDMLKMFFTLTISFFAVQAWFFIKFRMSDFNGPISD